MNDIQFTGFVDAECELPCEDGTYEVIALVLRDGHITSGITEAYYNSDTGEFEHIPGVADKPAWRYPKPDRDDLAEFRSRSRYNYPDIIYCGSSAVISATADME